jgi:hypothetical protein
MLHLPDFGMQRTVPVQAHERNRSVHQGTGYREMAKQVTK